MAEEHKQRTLSVRLDEYRKSLLEKVRDLPQFQGLDDSKIIEKILEIANQQPGSFSTFLESEQNWILLQHQIDKYLGEQIFALTEKIHQLEQDLHDLRQQIQKQDSLFSSDLD